MSTHILDALHSGRVLLMDGAMGTELQRAGLGEHEYGERWNALHPERVLAVHQAYVRAGAEVLLTNTFQMHGSSDWCAGAVAYHPWPYSDGALDCLKWSANALARAAIGPDGYVLADVGPMVDPRTGREFTDLRALMRRVAGVGPVSAVLLETCSTPRARWAVQYARSFAQRAALLSLTYRRDKGRLTTLSGHTPEWFARRAARWEVAALGVNCGRDIGMDEIIEIIRRYRAVTDLPLFARPNAGTPTKRSKRWIYPHTPDRMAERLPELLEAGANMVGGCCGTTPEHITAFRPVVEAWNAGRK